MTKTIRATDCLVVVLSSLVLVGCAKNLPELPLDAPYIPGPIPELENAAPPVVEPIPVPQSLSTNEVTFEETAINDTTINNGLESFEEAPVVSSIEAFEEAPVVSSVEAFEEAPFVTSVETFEDTAVVNSVESLVEPAVDNRREAPKEANVNNRSEAYEQPTVAGGIDVPLLFISNDLVKALAFITGMDPVQAAISSPVSASEFGNMVKDAMIRQGYQFVDQRVRGNKHLTTSFLEVSRTQQLSDLTAIMALDGVLIKRTYLIRNNTVEPTSSYVIRGIDPQLVNLSDEVIKL